MKYFSYSFKIVLELSSLKTSPVYQLVLYQKIVLVPVPVLIFMLLFVLNLVLDLVLDFILFYQLKF